MKITNDLKTTWHEIKNKQNINAKQLQKIAIVKNLSSKPNLLIYLL